MQDLEQLWDELNQQPAHRFSDWPNRDVPKGQPGVYLIYQGNDLKYVGMASANLYGRLSQHARGRRSGDQFCVYVSDRLVMKNLTDEPADSSIHPIVVRVQARQIKCFVWII